ncbi:hypothetical protein [Nocardia nova]|uniref:hypothetical protein n=1 Tax=Nocardia nova TaxID=37330 RepID=UPI0007A49DED
MDKFQRGGGSQCGGVGGLAAQPADVHECRSQAFAACHVSASDVVDGDFLDGAYAVLAQERVQFGQDSIPYRGTPPHDTVHGIHRVIGQNCCRGTQSAVPVLSESVRRGSTSPRESWTACPRY